MKITNVGLNQVNPYKRNQQQAEKAQKTSKPTADQLEISAAAKSMQHKITRRSRTSRTSCCYQIRN